MPAADRWKTVVFALVTIAGASLAGLAGAEILARLFYDGRVVTGSLIVNDPELAFRMRPGVSCIDDSPEFTVRYRLDPVLGVRVSGPGARAPERPDIAFFGDSFVFGHGVQADETFVSRLRDRFPDRSFLNAGVNSYGPDQEYVWARRLRANLHPGREVVCFYEGNDFEDFGRYGILERRGDRFVTTPPTDPSGTLRRRLTSLPGYGWLCRLHLWSVVKALIQRRRLDAGRQLPRFVTAPDCREAKETRTVENITALFHQWQSEVGTDRFLVVFIPAITRFRGKVHPLLPLLKNRLTEAQSPWIDLADAAPAQAPARKRFVETCYYYVDSHWTPAGHEWAADALADSFLRRDWLVLRESAEDSTRLPPPVED